MADGFESRQEADWLRPPECSELSPAGLEVLSLANSSSCRHRCLVQPTTMRLVMRKNQIRDRFHGIRGHATFLTNRYSW